MKEKAKNTETLSGEPLLGEVAFDSSETKYLVNIQFDGKNYRWIATRYKDDKLNYTLSDIWCIEPERIKSSIKKKMRKMVEAAVSNLA